MPRKPKAKGAAQTKIQNPFDQIEKETERALRALKVPIAPNTVSNLLAEMYAVAGAVLNDPIKLLNLCEKAEDAEIERLRIEKKRRFEKAREVVQQTATTGA